MPGWTRFRDGRPLKRWRYAGIFGEDLLCCAGTVSVGGLPQAFWAVWDRRERVLRERTRLRAGAVLIRDGLVRVRDRGVAIDLAFDEREGTPLEVTSDHHGGQIWTRKRAGLRFAGSVVLDGAERRLLARGVLDDSAGYHARDTAWCWSAGVGDLRDGTPVAWNLVDGVHDAPTGSERAVWVGEEPHEVAPVTFDAALTEVRTANGALALRCAHEAVRRRRDDLLLLRSDYEQPFGAFAGTLGAGLELAGGLGVMERHAARW